MHIACAVELASRQSSLSTGCLRTSLPPSVPSAVPDCAERQDRRLAGDGEQLVECFNTRQAAASHQDPITSTPPSRFVQPLECIRKPLGPFGGEGVVFYLATHMLQRRRHPDQPPYPARNSSWHVPDHNRESSPKRSAQPGQASIRDSPDSARPVAEQGVLDPSTGGESSSARLPPGRRNYWRYRSRVSSSIFFRSSSSWVAFFFLFSSC